MGTTKRTLSIIWLLRLFISGFVVVIPPGYFYISYSYIAGNLASEAEINARIISQTISLNPDLWEFEHVRIEEYLDRRPLRGDAETRRVFNSKNDLISESVNELASPILTESSVLMDSGVAVGRLDISRSLRPLLKRSGLVALVATLSGLGMYLALRSLLLRSLNRAQILVEQNEARYRAVVEDLPMLLCRFLPDGTLSFVNNAFCRFFDKTIEEMVGHKFQLPLALEEKQRFEPSMFGLLTADDSTRTYELRVIAGNGEIRWQRWIVRAIFQEAKQVEFQSIGEDITEQRRATEALRESEIQFRTLFDTMTEGVALHEILYDEGGTEVDYRIISANPAFENHTGLKSEEILGLPATKVYGVDNAPYLERYALVASSGQPESFETYFPAMNRHFRISVTSPKRGRFVTVFENITESKRAEEEKAKLQERLLQVEKIEAVGQLAGGVAHDFNNMLAVILGHTELALDWTSAEDETHIDLQEIHKDLQEIHKAASRSADLTRQLLAFARKQTVSPKVLDLNDTVSSMIKMLQRLIGEDIDLAWMPGHNLWNVEIDPSQVDQILANLAVNARDAIAGIGKVTIETANVVIGEVTGTDQQEYTPGEYVLLAVTDNGAGMGKEVLNRVFEPFFTTKELGKGTGLGLATLYGIVKQNQGLVYVYSEPGQGTTFKIYLPRFRGEAVDAKAQFSTGRPPVGNETVLLVEDEEAVMNLGKRILSSLGYTVLSAETPGKAIRLAKEYAGDIQLLITDVVMPEMNGRELAERLTSKMPDLKCLFMSGYTADVIAHRGVLDEGVQFIHKPFSLREMAEKVREILES